jgi:hypothetical protein
LPKAAPLRSAALGARLREAFVPKEMKLEDIHFHDSELICVIEYPDVDDLVFEVNYPADWENNVFERRCIVFHDVLNYSVQEGPFVGPPTLLDAYTEGVVGDREKVTLQTNAGTRSLEYASVDLVGEYRKAQQ